MNPDSPKNHDNPIDLDNYQQAWQSQASQTRVTIDTNLLQKEVQRNQQDFQATIFRRDFTEVVMGLLLLPVWVIMGVMLTLPWTWYLTVPAIIWVIGFFLVDRMRHPQTPSDPSEPLIKCVKNSLTQMEHQIWLVRNVFWWYLLPYSLSLMTFFVHTFWLASSAWWEFLAITTISGGFLLIVYGAVYYLNQYAGCSNLEPRREELLTLLTSLGDESTAEHVTRSQIKSDESSRTLRRWALLATSCFVALVAIAFSLTGGRAHLIYSKTSLNNAPTDYSYSSLPYMAGSNYDGPPRSSGPAGDLLANLITGQRKEKDLVGLAAMVMIDGQIEAAATHGERMIRSGVPLEIGDRWHLGGITKSLTATMIARLIESGQMQWSDTIGEIFSEASVHEDWKPVTLRQLLTDTAGAPKNFPKEVWHQRPALGTECMEARREAVLNVITEKPARPPGKKYVYSSVGYTIAGAMAEKITGDTWKDLMKREVFDPFELSEAGFGPPKSTDPSTTEPGLEQPRGHHVYLSEKFKFLVDSKKDNTPIIGPAGTVHMSLSDLCTYATEHLRGELGEGNQLSAETYQLLHAPELSYYAYGWIKKEPSKEIPHTVYWHNGSNTLWYALVAFIPEKNMVVAITSNDGDIKKGEAAAWEIVKASVKGFPSKEAPASEPTSTEEN